jgi:hypothetical protein
LCGTNICDSAIKTRNSLQQEHNQALIRQRNWPAAAAATATHPASTWDAFTRTRSATASAPGPGAIALYFLGFVGVWTIYGCIAGAGLSLHGDVTEAYAWGREFRLGYNQHPPFWAWIAGIWFLIFPNQNWSFHLLAVVNSALGLLGACWEDSRPEESVQLRLSCCC